VISPSMTAHILAIETSTEACSAALCIGGEVLERYALAPRQHAALILPMIESVLAEAGIGVQALDAIAFGRGPGAFTGVRIAASIVQGIAFAAELPVVPVSTLAALALGAMRETGETQVMAALDARKDEVYWGRDLQKVDTLVLHGSEVVCPPANVPQPGPGRWIGAGSGWLAYGEPLMQRCGDDVIRVLPDLEPRAGDVARLGLNDFVQGKSVAADAAVPVYLRDNVADARSG
jgi:tRNA threonylcarbamoyladenosine biosynthesis protein TsaB